jgi:hypothetical protein
MDKNVIYSVLGFDLNAEITDNEGNVIPSGTTCNYIPEEKPQHTSNIDYYNRWTNFNTDLLSKIRDYKRLNT